MKQFGSLTNYIRSLDGKGFSYGPEGVDCLRFVTGWLDLCGYQGVAEEMLEEAGNYKDKEEVKKKWEEYGIFTSADYIDYLMTRFGFIKCAAEPGVVAVFASRAFGLVDHDFNILSMGANGVHKLPMSHAEGFLCLKQ